MFSFSHLIPLEELLNSQNVSVEFLNEAVILTGRRRNAVVWIHE